MHRNQAQSPRKAGTSTYSTEIAEEPPIGGPSLLFVAPLSEAERFSTPRVCFFEATGTPLVDPSLLRGYPHPAKSATESHLPEAVVFEQYVGFPSLSLLLQRNPLAWPRCVPENLLPKTRSRNDRQRAALSLVRSTNRSNILRNGTKGVVRDEGSSQLPISNPRPAGPRSSARSARLADESRSFHKRGIHSQGGLAGTRTVLREDSDHRALTLDGTPPRYVQVRDYKLVRRTLGLPSASSCSGLEDSGARTAANAKRPKSIVFE
ncbi:hypothetical protein GGP79_001091 [Salinibacter ruber]|nr:hypothetical protein [Salinibacter ruber]